MAFVIVRHTSAWGHCTVDMRDAVMALLQASGKAFGAIWSAFKYLVGCQ